MNKHKFAPYSKLIPLVFGVIIAAFVAKLWYDNINLTERNARIRQSFLDANARNGKLVDQLDPITKRLDRISATLEEESRRRSTAEARANALQKENEFLRSSKQCSISIDPDAVEKGRKEGNTVVIQAAPADKQQ